MMLVMYIVIIILYILSILYLIFKNYTIRYVSDGKGYFINQREIKDVDINDICSSYIVNWYEYSEDELDFLILINIEDLKIQAPNDRLLTRNLILKRYNVRKLYNNRTFKGVGYLLLINEYHEIYIKGKGRLLSIKEVRNEKLNNLMKL